MLSGRRSLKFYQADVFSAQPFGGNPVAVFPEADGLTDDQLRDIGLSPSEARVEVEKSWFWG